MYNTRWRCGSACKAPQRERSVSFVLDRLSLGVVLIASTGRLLHVNSAGEAMLLSGDGLVRTAEGLRAAKEDDKRLQRLIDAIRHCSADAPSAGGHLSVSDVAVLADLFGFTHAARRLVMALLSGTALLAARSLGGVPRRYGSPDIGG